MPLARRAGSNKKRLFHTAVTSSDSIYNTWQTRVMYYWFKKYQNEPGSEMGGFTRILHSGKADKFMEEIPTFVAQPLPPGTDQVCCRHPPCSFSFGCLLLFFLSFKVRFFAPAILNFVFA